MVNKESLRKIKIGFVPTRRNIFSADAAIEFANYTRDKLDELGVNYVDIQDVNDDGLLYDDEGLEKVYKKFVAEDIDGLFIANENFGTEYEVARLAAKFNVPVLLWGPKDEAPAPDGSRQRDTQCGLFAIGKVLRHFNVPFTYIRNSDISDPSFSRGVIDFIKVCNVVKTFRNTRILQIGPRPFDFWSVIVNEGELLEKFGIQLSPIPLGELTSYMKGLIENADPRIEETKQFYRKWCDVQITDEDFTKVAALKLAMGDKMDQYGCNAGTIQCWTELQAEIGILPYASEALLQTEGRPVTCEVDINGAISELLAESATLGEEKALFADVNCRHPENENGELLQHLGTFAFQTAKDRPVLPPSHFVFDYPGSAAFGVKDGTYTLVRFDGDHGDYSMLVGNAKTCEGPYEQGTYAWFEFKDLNRFEAKYVYGPYIHHMAGVRADVVPILAEAGKYLGVKADYFDPIADKVDAYWYGDLNTILDEDQK
ncbi:L-fucose/L-arabinose isomerase family protein [Lactobacillus delbrueckii subsp. indicus]|uniref:L-fucose/L-arabinose isomerase family protein n=1 Tax=Lactobacillus delbrueckii TaxID=1584 RepID=UPI00222258BE|nr:L-fucose/L-arabinose isomerase family protein [Lactobacillus delbrueckii]UYX12592.1 L-fucose/L-arabinose isomerase family protein [Lactobacillus delbrueckii]UYY84407.1 L-fucose/L-arabinose isomerase family protein [Lactobacillus delbrueckii subsp. indicus]